MNSLEKIINWCVEKLRCCHGNQCICAVVQSNWQPEMLNNSNAIARAPICCIFLNHFHGCMMYVAAVWVEKARASWRAALHFVAIFFAPIFALLAKFIADLFPFNKNVKMMKFHNLWKYVKQSLQHMNVSYFALRSSSSHTGKLYIYSYIHCAHTPWCIKICWIK